MSFEMSRKVSCEPQFLRPPSFQRKPFQARLAMILVALVCSTISPSAGAQQPPSTQRSTTLVQIISNSQYDQMIENGQIKEDSLLVRLEQDFLDLSPT